jgi:hypothetical protein
LAFLPSVLVVGLGVWNKPAALQGGLILELLGVLGQTVQDSGLPMAPWAAIPVVVVAAVFGLALPWSQRSLPRLLHWFAAGMEAATVLVGLVATLGLVAVATSVDRSVFWGGLLVAALIAGPPQSVTPTDTERRVRRAGALAFGVALALVAGLTVLEGPGFHSPVFRGGEWWGSGIGRHPLVGGGLWMVAGGVGGLAMARGTRDRLPTDPTRWRWAAAALVGGAVLGCGLPDPAPLRLARSLSLLGILALAAGAAPLLMGYFPLPPTILGRLDPRPIMAFLLPLVVYASVTASRGLLIAMWTAPGPLGPGVEQLSARTGIFAVEAGEDVVHFTDRQRTLFGSVGAASGPGRWSLDNVGVDAVEELDSTAAGELWMSVGRWEPEPKMGLMSIDPIHGPGPWVDVPDCWIASWTEVPAKALGHFSQLQRGDVLLGCEGTAAAYLFRPSVGRTVAVLDLDDDVEAAVFHPDGQSFYGVSLWGDPSVSRYEWPSGERIEKGHVGPFNWALLFDSQGLLWVSRFFEGMAVLMDPESLEVVETIPLSFGVRAMVHDPVHDKVWASAAYSGRLWEVDAFPPYARRVHALCGQGRDLAVDPRGRVVIATDCGIFRLDPEEMPAI